MNFDEELNLLSGKKQGKIREDGMLPLEESNEKLQNSIGENDTSLPIRARKTGVWSEDVSKSAKGKNGSTNIIEIERFQNEKQGEVEDGIPEIPDIDDMQDDPLNLPDVKPVISVDKLTYKELDNQFENFQSEQMNFGNLGDIDLSLLTNKLFPEKDVQPCMEVWTMESLFNDLSRSSA